MRYHVSPMFMIGLTATLTASLAVNAPLASGGDQRKPASAAQQPPMKVDLDELEDNPTKFLGRTVVVEGEVDRVLGPNLFTIDERDWKDLEREMPVVVPEAFTSIAKADAPIRVIGVVQMVPIAQVERRGPVTDAKIRAEIETKPAILASEVTTIAAVPVNMLVKSTTKQ